MSTTPGTPTLAGAAPAATPPPPAPTDDLGVVARLLPYLWEFRGRVLLALGFLIAAKLANITVPS